MSLQNPKSSVELRHRIQIVRRDIGSLCFHFTRSAPPDSDAEQYFRHIGTVAPGTPALAVLTKILRESALKGSTRWCSSSPIVCFTDTPITEFAKLFSLPSISVHPDQIVRYEPYGIAVSKRWLYDQGGRPVIYDEPRNASLYDGTLRFRQVDYDPANGVDYSWEREWRIATTELSLDPHETLVVVPTAEEAFQLMHDTAVVELDPTEIGTAVTLTPRWLAVSLDVLGYDLQV